MDYPLIGITTYERNERGHFALPALYSEAVRRAGGIPVLLPPGEPHPTELLARLDGLILSGGVDVDPALYGGRPHAKIEAPDPERDGMELALVAEVMDEGKPTLCICRGMQLLNVALGGTLIEHLPDEVGETVAHQAVEGGHTWHPVVVAAESRVGRLMGEEGVPASWHHQAIRDLAPPLTAVAQAPDGTIEAVELEGHPWLVGVQWHPEISAAEEAAQQRLFDALVEAARSSMGRGRR